MDALKIIGGRSLKGQVRISGSKNASLPIMAAALLASGKSVLDNVPELADVYTLGKVLEHMGVKVERIGHCLHIDASYLNHLEAPYELVRTMRASILVLGPLLARFGEAKVSLPGGCAIGARPIEQHLQGLERLGATIKVEHGYVIASAKKLLGTELILDMPTVTGTENLMLAASLAQGVTTIRNAAREPEIVDLAKALSSMGVHIEGAGSECIIIHGNSDLQPYNHRVVADRIEFGTFLVAGALVGEDMAIVEGVPEHQAALIDKLRASGAQIQIKDHSIKISKSIGRPKPVEVQTAPYPGFPTDMQAQLMALLTVANGVSVVTENIFENRFMHVAELDRLGANIRVDGGKAIIEGVNNLSGSIVMATDLRASACLVLAGLIAEGETVVRRIYHIDRGYEHIEQRLCNLGADIVRFKE
ncbi:MAG: UDP-N-acetylglucosamine 1-carboxyvinyltransferase [Deltaproteobacteria bacterium]|nr:UDP-N-acetylglucosamine 1-carboxyvinyltransferase [Deltaproteobacteria bacterium]